MAKIVLGLGTSHTPMLLASDETLLRFVETDQQIKHRDKEGCPVTYGDLLEKADPRLAHIVAPEHLVGDLIQSGHPLFGLVWINPERVSGAPCFYGTRVPIKTLFDSLAAGQTLEEFLDDFEGVSREQAEAMLELAGTHLLDDLPKP